jgi:hypothetical protein
MSGDLGIAEAIRLLLGGEQLDILAQRALSSLTPREVPRLCRGGSKSFLAWRRPWRRWDRASYGSVGCRRMLIKPKRLFPATTHASIARWQRLPPVASWAIASSQVETWTSPGSSLHHQWPGLQGVVMVESERQIPEPSPQTDKFERETRFYITSLLWIAAQLGPAVRAHWMVENGLHWVMDVTFRDDQCRIRTDHAPANFTTIKHMALNLIRRARGKDSLRLRRKVAAWDDDFLASLIAA